MKKRKQITLFGMLISSILSICFTACNDHEADGWYSSIPNGGYFLRANTLRFYYMDGNGKSIINPDDSTTFPVTYGQELDNPIEKTEDYDKKSGTYNGRHNGIYYDQEEKLYYCKMTAYGDEKQSTYSYPAYVNGEVDSIDITYKYTDKDIIGGKYWGKILSWKYNGQHVYSDDDGNNKKVFITKANGKTTVSLKR